MEIIACTFTDISGNSTQGQAQLATLGTPERLARGAKRGAIVFGASIFFLPVPGLHWIPIAGLVAGIYYFIKIFLETKLIRSAEADCPTCKHKVIFAGPISAKGSKEICPNCRTLVTMKPNSLKLV